MKFPSRQDVGITVFITTKWIFCCLLTAPYCTSPSGFPVYMNGFDAVGLFTLQVTDEIWPATAGINLQQPTISQAIEKSTYFDIVAEQEEADRL